MSTKASMALLRGWEFLCVARIFTGGRDEPRSISTWAAVSALLMSCLSLSACGGGGGGGSSSSLSVSLSPSSVTATFQQGAAYSFNETATVNGSIPNTVYILVTDSADSVQQDISIQQQSNNTFVATITTLTTLPVGSRQGTLTLELCGDSACSQVLASTSLPYDFTVSAPPPALSVTPQSLNFAAVAGSTQAPAVQTLNVSVSGLNWTATASPSWLTLSAATGQGTGTVNVSVNPAGLSPGTNSGSVTVTDSDGTSVTIPVILTLTASQLTLNPQALAFTVTSNTSTAALTQTVAVSDQLSGQAGDPGLQWSAGSVSVPWLQITPTSGNTASGSTAANVSIVASQLTSMANGSYSGTISFSYTSADGVPHTLALPVSLLLNSPLNSITVTPANPPAAISEGPAVQFTATGAYADGYSQNVSGQVNWASSAASIASINNSGRVQPLAPGNTTISATMPGTAISGSTQLTVQAPTGLAYVVNSTDGTVSQFVFNSNGILQPMATPTAPTGNNPFAIAFTPSNQFAYVVNNGDSTISQYSVSSGGALTPLNPAMISVAGYSPIAIAIDPSGQHAYVSTWGSVYAVLQFSIGANGALSAMTTPAVSAGSAPDGLVVHPSGKYAYVTNLNSDTVSEYSIDASGNLVSTGTVTAGSGPQQVVIDPAGQYAYVVNMSFTDEVPSPNGYISQYSIGSNGALTPMATPMVAAGVEPWALALSPNGSYAYVANGGIADDSGTVSGFTIGAGGSLTPFSGPQTPAQVAPRDIAVDPSGQFVYVLNQGNNDVWQYTIGAGGVLTRIGTTATGNGGRAMVVRAP